MWEAVSASVAVPHSNMCSCVADKELWEPVIADLMRAKKPGNGGVTDGPLLREAWSLDGPNHGEAAVLNAVLLENGRVKPCKL